MNYVTRCFFFCPLPTIYRCFTFAPGLAGTVSRLPISQYLRTAKSQYLLKII
jgi:hypothetical protein